ncbi:MAG TPA: DoxX family protein [Streptosporangiaceae bacterium]
MNMLHAVARIALAWVFVRAGFDVFRDPSRAAATAGPLLSTLRSQAPGPVPDDVTLVRANAAAQVAGGVALAVGVAPRLAAAVLIGSLVPTTYAGHPYWTLEDPAQRTGQRNHFNKNLGLLGGLILVVLSGRN